MHTIELLLHLKDHLLYDPHECYFILEVLSDRCICQIQNGRIQGILKLMRRGIVDKYPEQFRKLVFGLVVVNEENTPETLIRLSDQFYELDKLLLELLFFEFLKENKYCS